MTTSRSTCQEKQILSIGVLVHYVDLYYRGDMARIFTRILGVVDTRM